MTESEAREKWCPFVRHQADEDCAPGNRFGLEENSTLCRCIASECMAWRWNTRNFEGIEIPDPNTKRGYCGLAGKP